MKRRHIYAIIGALALFIILGLLVVHFKTTRAPLPPPSATAPVLPTQSPSPTPRPSPSPTPTPAYPPPTPLGFTQLWRFTARDTVWDMALADLTGRGFTDLLVASYDKQVYALDAAGALRWQVATRGPVYAVAAADLDGDGRTEIALGSDDNTLYLLDSDGTVLWQHLMPSRVTALAVADLSGAGLLDIVAGVWDGSILAFDAAGALRWQTAVAGGPTQIRAADLFVAGDGAAEIIVATETGALTVLRGDGQIWGETALDAGVRLCTPTDLDGDGEVEIVAATGAGTVLVLNSDGSERWHTTVNSAIAELRLGDLDNDGMLEILVGTGPAPGQVIALTADGEPRWRVKTPGAIWALAVVDLDNDGKVEVVAGADDGTITIFDQYGQRRGGYATPARVQGIMTADLDSNGQPELLVHSGDFVYALAADPVGEVGEPRPPDPATLLEPPHDLFPPVGADEIELLAVGDVMLSRSVALRAGVFGPLYPFAATAALLQRADIAAINLECVLSTQGKPATKSFVLRAHPRLADGLRDAGIDVAFLSNNHVLDYGPEALAETMAALDERNIRHTGAGADLAAALAPAIVEVKGLRVAFLAFTNAAPGSWYAGASSPGVTSADVTQMSAAIKQARQAADLVIVAFHASQEYNAEPDPMHRQLARVAIESGAALVIGHGSHMLQGAERYGDNGFIAYSLGNFVFDIDLVDAARDGAILRAVLGRDGVRQVDLLPTRIVADVQPRLLASADGSPVVQRLFPNSQVGQVANLPHYDLDVSLDYAGHRVEAIERVALINDAAENWSEVVLSVPPAYWPDTFSLSTVEVTIGGNTTAVAPELRGTMMHIPLPQPLLPEESVEIRIAFALRLPEINPAAWSPLGNFGWGQRVTQVGEWYPALVPYRASQGWLTWEYHPVGDPTVNVLGTYDVRIATAEDVIVAGAGLLSQEGGIWRFHLDRARSFAFLASPEYQVVLGMAGGIPVRSYYLSGYEAAGRAVRDTAVRAITLFSDLYGVYPYPEFVVAQNGYHGAMEYSALCSQTTYAYGTYNGEPASLLVSLTAHEIAHQWWYGAVGNDQVREPWLDEALAMYSELLFYEQLYPELVNWWWDFRVEQFEPGGMVDVTIYDYEDTRTYVHKMYGQGARFVAELRALMGDAAFFAFLKDYRAAGDGRLVTKSDFFAAARAHTDADLPPLLERYFRNLD